jgi:hypothetical protein
MAATAPGRNVEHDEWVAFPRRYLREGSMDQIYAAELPKAPRNYPAPPTPWPIYQHSTIRDATPDADP